VEQAGPASHGATAYLNLETGDCHGDNKSVAALINSGVSRVVVGVRNPLSHLRGTAIAALRASGLVVDVLGEAGASADPEHVRQCLQACLQVNEVTLPAQKSLVMRACVQQGWSLSFSVVWSLLLFLKFEHGLEHFWGAPVLRRCLGVSGTAAQSCDGAPLLSAEVRHDGRRQDCHIVRSLGLGVVARL
jgi:hypothetical protein